MKISRLLLALLVTSLTIFRSAAQVDSIGTYTLFSISSNIKVDDSGRIFTAVTTGLASSEVRLVHSDGSVTLVAGGGTTFADWVPATASKLSRADNIFFDVAGNMLIADGGYGVIRKVDKSGIISTVAGDYTIAGGYSGDGGPALTAGLSCTNVCTDAFGNMFIADGSHYVIRKVDPSGIITTIAGNGTRGFSGDGGAATAAQLDYAGIFGMVADKAGNLFLSDGTNNRVRKINTLGIINTVAGNGSTGHKGAGGPAITASIDNPQGLAIDKFGNLYIAEYNSNVVGVVNAAGILTTVAGNYTAGYSGDGGPATTASMDGVSDIAMDNLNGITYIADWNNHRVRKLRHSHLYSDYSTASFDVSLDRQCTGPELSISTHSYISTYSVKCYYGDSHTDFGTVTPGSGGTGMISFTHPYANPGVYTIKIVLLNGSTTIDSVSFSYDFLLCNTFCTRFYNDKNNNCSYDSGDTYLSHPMLVEIDSNSIPIDSISCTSGIYYTAFGSPGDIYSFKIISSPKSMYPTCPATGIITDTLHSTIYNKNRKYVAMQCIASGSSDFSVKALVNATGVIDQNGNIFVSNLACTPDNATVTLHYSKHYQVKSRDIAPAPLSYSDSTITWDVSGLSDADAKLANLYYIIWTNPDSGNVVGDPIRSYVTVSPNTMKDLDTSNNWQVRIDTVRGGCDPNHMDVTPAGYIPAGTRLEYTVEFTNTGNDTTYNVYVMDTLSDYLDISSFRLEMVTAKMNILKLNSNGHSILKFDFPGINLLDSMHHPEDCSRGLVFTINTRSGIPDGTHIFNSAGIFFDYNPVVLTNTTENIIGIPSSLFSMGPSKKSGFRLYPNPANTILHTENHQEPCNYILSDMMGNKIQEGILKQGDNVIDISTLPRGVYLLKPGNIQTLKFVKL